MELHHDINAILSRVLNGTATEKERSLVQNWLYSLDLSDATDQQKDLTPAKISMLKNILEGDTKVLPPKADTGNGVYRLLRRISKVAAVIVGIMLLGAIVYKNIPLQKGHPKTDPEDKNWVTVNSGTSARYITLPDKSRIWLNAHSQLRYISNSFAASDRNIWLKGEAFFEVEHDTTKPFIVYADNIATKVLGTGFNIAAYQQDDAIKVTLVHGKVTVRNDADHQTVLLAPQQQLQYSKENKQWGVVPYTQNPADNWMTGGLVFNETPITAALDDLAHHFNVRIQYNSKHLKDKKVTARFDSSKELSFMLQNILFVHDLGFRSENGVIQIFSK